MHEEYFEDYIPIDYSYYLSMSQEELDAEIERLEAEARKERDQIIREKQLKAV